MNKTFKQELYTSPRVRIVEIKARQVLCQSNPGGTEDVKEGTEVSPFYFEEA